MSTFAQEFAAHLASARAISKKYNGDAAAIIESVNAAILSSPDPRVRLFQTSGYLPHYRIDGWICNNWFVGLSCGEACTMRFDPQTGCIVQPSGYRNYTCDQLLSAIGSLPDSVLDTWVAQETPMRVLETRNVVDIVNVKITSSGRIMGEFKISRERIMMTSAEKYHHVSEITLAIGPSPDQYDPKVTRDLCSLLNGSGEYKFKDWRSHDILYGLLAKLGAKFA